MKTLRRVLLIFLSLEILCSCGTYRTGASGYKGVGGYVAPSDYSHGVDAAEPSPAENAKVGERLSKAPPANFIPHGAFKMYWPVTVVHVNRGFRPPNAPRHEGLDLGGKKGLPILAAHEGRVIYVGHEFHGFGNLVIVEYSAEWATLYAHLDRIAVREGQTVDAGEPLGAMGATGRATGVHLHFELRHNRDAVDPLPLLTRPAKMTFDTSDWPLVSQNSR